MSTSTKTGLPSRVKRVNSPVIVAIRTIHALRTTQARLNRRRAKLSGEADARVRVFRSFDLFQQNRFTYAARGGYSLARHVKSSSWSLWVRRQGGRPTNRPRRRWVPWRRRATRRRRRVSLTLDPLEGVVTKTGSGWITVKFEFGGVDNFRADELRVL